VTTYVIRIRTLDKNNLKFCLRKDQFLVKRQNRHLQKLIMYDRKVLVGAQGRIRLLISKSCAASFPASGWECIPRGYAFSLAKGGGASEHRFPGGAWEPVGVRVMS
jgi:hypothetical protein